jgi:hypothetical protein
MNKYWIYFKECNGTSNFTEGWRIFKTVKEIDYKQLSKIQLIIKKILKLENSVIITNIVKIK